MQHSCYNSQSTNPHNFLIHKWGKFPRSRKGFSQFEMSFTFWLGPLILASAFLWALVVAPPPLPQQLVPQPQGCDYSQGSWVIDDDDDDDAYDASKDCPFIGQGFDCLRNGRPDKEYLKYRWKPSTCDLPR